MDGPGWDERWFTVAWHMPPDAPEDQVANAVAVVFGVTLDGAQELVAEFAAQFAAQAGIDVRPLAFAEVWSLLHPYLSRGQTMTVSQAQPWIGAQETREPPKKRRRTEEVTPSHESGQHSDGLALDRLARAHARLSEIDTRLLQLRHQIQTEKLPTTYVELVELAKERMALRSSIGVAWADAGEPSSRQGQQHQETLSWSQYQTDARDVSEERPREMVVECGQAAPATSRSPTFSAETINTAIDLAKQSDSFEHFVILSMSALGHDRGPFIVPLARRFDLVSGNVTEQVAFAAFRTAVHNRKVQRLSQDADPDHQAAYVGRIIDRVAAQHKIAPEDVKHVVKARHLTAYLCSQLTAIPLVDLGRTFSFNPRQFKRISSKFSADPLARELIEELRAGSAS